ncbi:MAG: alpha-L-fucosidase [Planctomycetes bacterium]|nr:alpha-L-fucosidase [Planctomycetota bacterium]
MAAAGLVASATAADTPARPKDYLNAAPEVVGQWQDDRFGLFVCWGPVSLTGLEIGWSRGAPPWGIRPGLARRQGTHTRRGFKVQDNLYKKWKPGQFDAREWVHLAKDARLVGSSTGVRHMIFLVKHHDGFCLYDTNLTDYKSTAPEAAWRHDVMKDIAEACHEGGVKLFIYYSQPDWHHPDFCGERHDRYIQYLHGQVRELLTRYGRIDGLWFDGLGAKAADWDAENLFKMARTIQPHLIINNRCGLPGDFDTPEQRLGRFQIGRPWKTCMTLGTQWSWKPHDTIKSLKQCIDVLVTCAVRGGNLALNANPMPEGQIEPRQADRFREIGQWLKKYGESIYSTRGGPFQSAAWGGTTHRDNTIYVHVLKWPDKSVPLPQVSKKIVSCSVLTGGTATVSQAGQGLEIAVPPSDRQELDTIIVLKLDGPAADLGTIQVPTASLTFGKKGTASNVFRNAAEFAPRKALDGDPQTRWGCDWGTHAAWLEVDLGAVATFDRALISEPYGRVRRFELQAKKGDQWETFYRGTTIGDDLAVEFKPTTARHVRLNLLETTDGPSIWEFQLFAPAAR